MGQNIQALGAKELGEGEKECSSRKWVMGLSLFITGSIGNMVAMAFASATILVPLESSQFVTNVFFSKFVNKKTITYRMWLGTWVAVLGTVITCIFGPNDARCFTIEEMASFWSNPIWIVYVIITFGASGCLWVVYYRLKASARTAHGPKQLADAALPALFAVASALIGGAQMIVHSKALAEIFDMLTGGKITLVEMLSSWFFWVELVITAGCGIFWAVQMNNSLALYDPLFIIPLLQASYITFGSTASGIFYQEFESLAENAWVGPGAWFFYVSGVGMVVTGILLLAPPSALAACCAACKRVRPPGEIALGSLDDDPTVPKTARGRITYKGETTETKARSASPAPSVRRTPSSPRAGSPCAYTCATEEDTDAPMDPQPNQVLSTQI